MLANMYSRNSKPQLAPFRSVHTVIETSSHISHFLSKDQHNHHVRALVSFPRECARSLAAGRQARDLAEPAIRARANLGRLGARAVALVAVARLAAALARAGDGTGVAVVCVDAAEHAAVLGDGALDDDVAGAAVVAAVAAAADQLAVVVGVEVLDLDRPEAVELDDLVGGLEGAAAVDVRSSRGLLESAVVRKGEKRYWSATCASKTEIGRTI